jgi:hypothetical protein
MYPQLASVFFFFCKKVCQTKSFRQEMLKNGEHQHKGRPHTHEKPLGAAAKIEHAVIEF